MSRRKVAVCCRITIKADLEIFDDGSERLVLPPGLPPVIQLRPLMKGQHDRQGRPVETRREFLDMICRRCNRVVPARPAKLADMLGWDLSYLVHRRKAHGIKTHRELLELLVAPVHSVEWRTATVEWRTATLKNKT